MFSHYFCRFTRNKKGSEEIGFYYFFGGTKWGQEHVIHRSNAGVVDQDVNSAMAFPNRIEHFQNRIFISYIRLMMEIVIVLPIGCSTTAPFDYVAFFEIILGQISSYTRSRTGYEKYLGLSGQDSFVKLTM